MSPNGKTVKANGGGRGSKQAAAAAALAGHPRPSSQRSPAETQGAPKAAAREQPPAAAKALFPAPKAPAHATPQALPPALTTFGDEVADRAFSTPDGGTALYPHQYAGSDASRFSYRAGYVEGRLKKNFKDVFDNTLFERDAFFAGFESGAQKATEAKTSTPPVAEGDRPQRLEPVTIETYFEKAKAGGKLSKLVKQHVWADTVTVEIDGKVAFAFARPGVFRGGDDGELKAFVSFFLLKEIGAGYSLPDFEVAWTSGCTVEVATKNRKAALIGADPRNIPTSQKQITLKGEVKVMLNNARSALSAAVWSAYRTAHNIGPRPKGEQNSAGKKAIQIVDAAWDLHAKQLKMHGTSSTSRYGMPWMEGKFTAEDGLADMTLDPVGQIEAVSALAYVFRGIMMDEYKMKELIDDERPVEFSVTEIAIFSTVLSDKVNFVKRGATCVGGSFESQIKCVGRMLDNPPKPHGENMKYLVAKWKHFGWTDKPDSKPALTALIKITDYPVSSRPLLAEDDTTLFVQSDGVWIEKEIPLAGAASCGNNGEDDEGGAEAAAEERAGAQRAASTP